MMYKNPVQSIASKIFQLQDKNGCWNVLDKRITYDEFMDFLVTRRSARNFKDKAVPGEVIQQIFDSIAFAPFGSAPHKVEITVVNNRKTIETALPYISEFLDNIVRWMDHPFMRYMIKRKNSTETFNTIKNHLYPIAKTGNYKLEFGDRITRDAPVILIFHAHKEAEEHSHNSMIYAVYAMLTAHALGLGATMVSIVPAAINKVKEVREIFKIPEENEAMISVILGYPKIKYKRGIRREKKRITWVE